MTGPDPQREPQSETAKKDSITKSHEEYMADEGRPSQTKQDYEAKKRGQGAHEKSDNQDPDGKPDA